MNPHDAIFKAVIGQIEHARGALRAVLPMVIAEALDWSALAREPGSFIDPALKDRHTDLLFSLPWRGGSAALLYLLFEHQSTGWADVVRDVVRAPHGLEAIAQVIWEDRMLSAATLSELLDG